MTKLPQPIHLQINTEEELIALHDAIELKFDMQNDVVLEPLIDGITEFKELALLSDSGILMELTKRKKQIDDSLDNLLVVKQVLEQLTYLKNKHTWNYNT